MDFLAVHETLKSLLQYHSLKGSILQCSTFFIVQLSHPYMTTGKTIALTRRTFVFHLDFDAGRDWGQEEKGMTKDEMAGWHHGLDGRRV